MSNKSIPATDPILFGDTYAYSAKPDAAPPNDEPVHWDVTEHSERLKLGSGAVLLRTSTLQRADDPKVGTWFAALLGQGNVRPMASTQFPWCPPAEAREKALAWARGEVAKMFGGVV